MAEKVTLTKADVGVMPAGIVAAAGVAGGGGKSGLGKAIEQAMTNAVVATSKACEEVQAHTDIDASAKAKLIAKLTHPETVKAAKQKARETVKAAFKAEEDKRVAADKERAERAAKGAKDE